MQCRHGLLTSDPVKGLGTLVFKRCAITAASSLCLHGTFSTV